MRAVQYNFLGSMASKSNYAQAVAAALQSKVDMAGGVLAPFGPLTTYPHAPITSGVYYGISCNDSNVGNAWTVLQIQNLDWTALLSPPNVNFFVHGRVIVAPPGSTLAPFSFVSPSTSPYRFCKTIAFKNDASTLSGTTVTAAGASGFPALVGGASFTTLVLIDNKGVLTAEFV